jgi:murein DD-endopeptidase MepM/ murein hydrolase activator NlpD
MSNIVRLPMPFNNPNTYKGHSGVDFPKPKGTPIRASARGVVGLQNVTPRGGINQWIDYYGGYPGVAYSHLDSLVSGLNRGEIVNYGDIIGYVGVTGFTTGPHLHSEVNGYASTDGYFKYFDPNNWIGKEGSGAGNGGIEIEVDEMKIVNIQGKGGVRAGGSFEVVNDKTLKFLGGKNSANAITIPFNEGTVFMAGKTVIW